MELRNDRYAVPFARAVRRICRRGSPDAIGNETGDHGLHFLDDRWMELDTSDAAMLPDCVDRQSGSVRLLGECDFEAAWKFNYVTKAEACALWAQIGDDAWCGAARTDECRRPLRR